MNKYRIVGVIDFILGLPILIFTLIVVVFTLPKLNALYSISGVNTSNVPLQILSITLNILLGSLDIFWGVKLFSKNSDKYFGRGASFIILTLILGGFLLAFMVLSLVLPIYQVTSQLK